MCYFLCLFFHLSFPVLSRVRSPTVHMQCFNCILPITIRCLPSANSITATFGRHAGVALFIEFASKFGHQRSLRFLIELTMTGKPSVFQSVSAEGESLHAIQFAGRISYRATSLLITVSCQA